VLHFPLVVVEIRVDLKDLLEVGHVELTFGLVLNHGFDVSEGWGMLANLEHVPGLVDLVYELEEKVILFWELDVIVSWLFDELDLLNLFRFHFNILLNWLLNLEGFFCLLCLSGILGISLGLSFSLILLLLFLLDFDLSLDFLNLLIELLLPRVVLFFLSSHLWLRNFGDIEFKTLLHLLTDLNFFFDHLLFNDFFFIFWLHNMFILHFFFDLVILN
jgi:hypothetical protein